MRFSLKVRYAIYGVFDLAYNASVEPTRSRSVSERQGIPARYMEQIFQQLRRAGLVTSKRGPGGGYVLARPAEEILLRDVIEAVEGPLDFAPKLEQDDEEASRRPDFLWRELTSRFSSVLAETTLARVCREADRIDVPRETSHTPMYFI
ncbi:MAG: Rrf2 family transcriptional regulator [Myxococcota bacterium]